MFTYLQDCVNETFSLRKDPAELCERFNLFCATSNTEDIDMFTLRKKRTELEIVKARRWVHGVCLHAGSFVSSLDLHVR